MNRKIVGKEGISELCLDKNDIIYTNQNNLVCDDFLPVGAKLHITDINMNDMPSESYQRSLVLEDWTTSVGTVFPSTETPSYRSDGTCSESSMHNFLHLSDTEDSITNSNLCALFGSECSHDTAMCINIPDTGKIFNIPECQKLSIKSKENSVEGDFSPLLMSENVQNWKQLFLQVNSTEQHLKSPVAVEQTKECVNRATVVKLTPLKDESLENNKLSNEEHIPLTDAQRKENCENRTIDKELSLLRCNKDDYILKNKQTSRLYDLNSAKYHFKKLVIKRKKTKLNLHFKSKQSLAKSLLRPISYYRKRVNHYIYGRYFKSSSVQKFKYTETGKTTFSNDHAYSASKFPSPKRHSYSKFSRFIQRQKQKRTTMCKIIEESSAIGMKDDDLTGQLLNNSVKTESKDNVNVSEVNNICKDVSLSPKASLEMDMPILTPLIITESSIGENSPESPPMPTLIPFTSENEHPPSMLNDCIPLLSSSSSQLVNSKQNKNYDGIKFCEHKFGNLDHKWKAPDVGDWSRPMSTNEITLTKSHSYSNEISGSHSYPCSPICVIDHGHTSGKTCRKARKSFPRSRPSGTSSSLNSIIAESFSATYSKPIVDTSRLQNTLNYQPVVLLERIPSVLPRKTVETENLCDSENTALYMQFQSDNNCNANFFEPEVDIIDGVKFLSFVSECHLNQFTGNSESSLPSSDYDESHKKTGFIIPTKTHDITQIKGWRKKIFYRDPDVTWPLTGSCTSWEHLVIKDLDDSLDFNQCQTVVPNIKCEEEKTKQPTLKESNLKITNTPMTHSSELKEVEENKSGFCVIEKDKPNISVITVEEKKTDACLKKMGKNSLDDNLKLLEKSKTNMCIKEVKENTTVSFSKVEGSKSNICVKKTEETILDTHLLDKRGNVACSKNEETISIENKEESSELMKLLKDNSIGYNSRPTSVNDILKALPKFTKQEQKITDDEKTNNNKLLKRLEEKCVGKATRSAFVSDILDDFLKTRSNLGINMLAQCNPNVLPIPADSSIFSVGLLRKQDVPIPNKKHSNEVIDSHDKKYLLNQKDAASTIHAYKCRMKHDTGDTNISQNLPKQEAINEKIVMTDIIKENSIDNDTVDDNVHTMHRKQPEVILLRENLCKNTNDNECLQVSSNSESEDERKDSSCNQYSFEGSSYTSRASANMKQMLPLIRNLHWSKKEQAHKKLTELFEELNNSGQSIESCSTLFCPIIDQSLAGKAASALMNVNTTSNNKACYLDDYNTFGKIAATKNFPHKTKHKPVACPFKDSSHRCRSYSDLTKSPPYSNVNQATRSKRLIKLPARYKDSIETITGNEGRALPTPASQEFKSRFYKKKFGEFDQNYLSQKCIMSHNKVLNNMLDELPDDNFISTKDKDYDQNANSSFSDTSESCSRSSLCIPSIQEQSSTSESEITKCHLPDKSILHTNTTERQNRAFFTKTDVNKSQMVDFDNFETLSPRGRELLSCMDKVIRVSLPRLPVDPEMVVKCQNSIEHSTNSSISFDSQTVSAMKHTPEFSMKNQTKVNDSSTLLQKHIAHSGNTMQSNVSASYEYRSSKTNKKNNQRYSRLKLSSLQSLDVLETVPVSVHNTRARTNIFSDKNPTLVRVQFSEKDGEFYIRKLENEEMKKVLLRNLPPKCVRKFSYNNNNNTTTNRLERCKSDGQITNIHTVPSPTNTINTFMRSHRKRKQNKCKLSCCSSDGSTVEQKQNCTNSVQQCPAQSHKKLRSLSLDNFDKSWNSCEKKEESSNSSDNSSSSIEKMISERKEETFNIVCDSRHDGNVLEEKHSVQMVAGTETPSKLKQKCQQFEKEKNMHEILYQQKIFNAAETPQSKSSSKRISMKFTDRCLASLQSSGKDNQTISISANTCEALSDINVNQLLAAAHKLCGPCIVKRVQLKNGKTVYVYDSMNTDTCSNLDNIEVDNVQNQMNNDMITEKYLLNDSSAEESSSLESLNFEYDDNENISLEDDHSSTSVWLSGSGEPCFVTRLSPENSVIFQEEETYSLCANSDKSIIPTIISCASISEEEFAKSLNPSESAMEIDQVSDVSQ